MATKKQMRALSLGVYFLLELTKSAQLCKMNGHWAFCSSTSLEQVPPLPSSVTHVDLSLNQIRQLSEDSFRGLESLVHLDLGSQRPIGLIIKNNTFRRLSNLTFLHLGDNRAMRLETDAFQGLSNLQTLILLHSDLDESILSGSYLQPLVSLQKLDLFGNKLKQFKPAMFFRNMTDLSVLDLSINRVNSICETDLAAFQDKHFLLLNVSTLHLTDMNPSGFNWTKCGNPFKNMSFDTLDISLNGLSAEKAKLFFSAILGTRINHLILSPNIMGSGFGTSNSKDPDRLTFDPLKSSGIQTINLSRNYINIVKWSVFRSLVDLVSMSLAGNKINEFERGAFLGLVNLQRLNLSNNLIGEIYSHTFQNLPNLILLDLTNNHIGIVQHESFMGLSNLLALDLTGNSLHSVYTFAHLPSLQELHLDDNKITTLFQLGGFASSATRIRLNNNRLQDMEDVYIILATSPKIVELNFGSNFISYCSQISNSNLSIPSSNSLQELYLQNCALQLIWGRKQCLDLFDHLNKLLILALGSNLLESLPKYIFKGLSSLHYLDLSYNSLTHLPRDIFPASLKLLDVSYNFLNRPDPDVFRYLSVVNLYMNRFFCDCNLTEFQTWANRTNVTLSAGLSQLHCGFPEALRGVALSDFTTDPCEEDDEQLMQALRFCLFIGCSAFLAVIIFGTIAYARFRGYIFVVYKKLKARVVEGPPQAPPLDNFQYDVYLCFTDSDFIWVESALLKRLDSQFAEQNQLNCCFEARDFLPGNDHLTNIQSAIWGSRKTLCVVSKKFLKDSWCLEAFMMAQRRMLEDLKEVLIVVIVGSIPYFRLMECEPIRTFVKNREYFQWPDDTQDLEWFFDRLIVKIFKDSQVKHPKGPKDGPDVELHAVRQVET